MNDSIIASIPSPAAEHNKVVAFANDIVILSKQEHIDLKWQVNYYKAQHKSALEREVALKKQREHEQAKVRDLNQRLYGKKTETSKKNSEQNSKGRSQTTPRSRGQQNGSKGQGRTQGPPLSTVTDILDIAENETICGDGGLPHPDLGVVPKFISPPIFQVILWNNRTSFPHWLPPVIECWKME